MRGWLGSKRRRMFALADDEQAEEPPAATASEGEDGVTLEEEKTVDAVLDLTADERPSSASQRTEIVISSLSSDDAQLLPPRATSSYRSLDDPIRHFSLRINPARRHLIGRLSLTDFHPVHIPPTSPAPSSPLSRSVSNPSTVTTLAAHTASLPIRRLPAFLTQSAARREAQTTSVRPSPHVAAIPQPILHPNYMSHPWSTVSSYRPRTAFSSSRHKLPLCVAAPQLLEAECEVLRSVTTAVVNSQCPAEEQLETPVRFDGVSCSDALGELSDMPLLEPA